MQSFFFGSHFPVDLFFGQVCAKMLRTPKNLPALSPMTGKVGALKPDIE